MSRTSMRVTRASVGIAPSVLVLAMLVACGEDGEPEPPGESIAEKLTRGLRFPQGMILAGPLPEPTDQISTLLPLGPTVRILPGESSLMALRVEDPDEREVEATLIQFSDAPSYVRVPAREDEGAHIVDNEFTAEDDLCEGLCDAVFTVTVTEAIEFTSGEISQITTRQIVVDCRQDGEAGACGGSDPTAMTEEQLCGDVTAGEIAWTSDPVLDAHLEAVRMLGAAAEVAAETLDSVRGQVSTALALDDADWPPIVGALGAAISAHTQAGLSVQLGEQGCALTFAQVRHALGRCDADAAETIVALGCSGVCQPAGDAAACASAQSSGCRGLLDGEPCAGQCLGACELVLDEPAECLGTCLGSCDGECPEGNVENCDGPCVGLCTGTCTTTSSETCSGSCTGLCDVTGEDVPECSAPLEPYCAPQSGATLDCPGDCFGAGAVDVGGGPCSASALAIGRALPRCEPPVVQLSFAFEPGLATTAQDEFALLVQELNSPIARLVGTLARIDLLIVANAELLAAAEGEIADHLASLQSEPETGGLACAERRVPEAAAWLGAQTAVLEQLRADATLLWPIPVPE